MIRGEKPSGYYVTYDGEGRKIEGETRQCAHCQFTWEYMPGSGNRRGLCFACKGLICAQQACIDEQKRLIAGTPHLCMPFTEKEKRIFDNAFKSHPDLKMIGEKIVAPPPGYVMTASGMIVPV